MSIKLKKSKGDTGLFAGFFKAALYIFLFFSVCVVSFGSVAHAHSLKRRHTRKSIRVKLSGCVYKPGVYNLRNGARLSDFEQAFWPPKTDGYRRGAILERKQRIIDQKVELRGIAREIKRLLVKMDYKRSFADSVKRKINNLKPLGMVFVHIENPVLLLDTRYNIKLKNGDLLIIPKNPNSVAVEGSVKRPGEFAYRKGESAGYYINEAHGDNERARGGFIYLLKSNGTVKAIKTGIIFWNKKIKEWEFSIFKKPVKIDPGDKIYVPFAYSGFGKSGERLTRLIISVYKRTGYILDINSIK